MHNKNGEAIESLLSDGFFIFLLYKATAGYRDEMKCSRDGHGLG